jgi:hypothetical protein
MERALLDFLVALGYPCHISDHLHISLYCLSPLLQSENRVLLCYLPLQCVTRPVSMAAAQPQTLVTAQTLAIQGGHAGHQVILALMLLAVIASLVVKGLHCCYTVTSTLTPP